LSHNFDAAVVSTARNHANMLVNS